MKRQNESLSCLSTSNQSLRWTSATAVKSNMSSTIEVTYDKVSVVTHFFIKALCAMGYVSFSVSSSTGDVNLRCSGQCRIGQASIFKEVTTIVADGTCLSKQIKSIKIQ